MRTIVDLLFLTVGAFNVACRDFAVTSKPKIPFMEPTSRTRMWVEKYRPKDIKDVVAQQEVRNLCKKKLPNVFAS